MLDELDVVVRAASTRLEDPGLEEERIQLLATVIAASREASDAMQVWVAQLLAEHRGSHTAWDLSASRDRLQRALEGFERAVFDCAPGLRRLLPVSPAESEGYDGAGSRPGDG
jgi:hypothetical protein